MRLDRDSNYLEMNFSRIELIEKLKENRETHKTEYEEAMRGYFMEVQEQTKELIKTLQEVNELAAHDELPEGKDDFERNFFMQARKPFSNLTSYDRAIRMLEMSTDDDVLLDENSFSCYVMDEWDWKEDFVATNAFYSGKFGVASSHR